MSKIESYEVITREVSSIRGLKKGFITNFYHSEETVNLWVAYQTLMGIKIGDTFFIIRKNEGFSNLFYISVSLAHLEDDIRTFHQTYDSNKEIWVVDLVGNKTVVSGLERGFHHNGYETYTSLVRMSRSVIEDEKAENEAEIGYASREDCREIEFLLKSHFDPFCEQLPLFEEIEKWQRNNNILVSKEGLLIAGFLIFEINGLTSYLRYWFTHPLHRNKKIGSKLIHRFFAEARLTKRQLFWVLQNNENAIKRYEHYGYVKEELYDTVLLKKPS